MIAESDLHDYEREAVKGESYIHQIACKLIVEVRDLQHKLNDPNYMYASCRVPRLAIVDQASRIDALHLKVKELEKLLDNTSKELKEIVEKHGT